MVPGFLQPFFRNGYAGYDQTAAGDEPYRASVPDVPLIAS